MSKSTYAIAVCALLLIAGIAQAQTTTTLSVVVGPEAALTVTSGTSSLAAASGNFAADFTGTTNFLYRIRTSKTGGTGSITLRVTSDFDQALGGPSVGSPPTAGDLLTYTCAVSSPGTPCTGSQTASTSAATEVGSFGTNAKSTKTGNTGSVNWTLTNDPVYATGTYSATVTFIVAVV